MLVFSLQEHLKAMVMGDGSALGMYEPGTRQEETALRGYLSNYGLTGHRALIPVKHLSGGEYQYQYQYQYQ